MKTRVLLSLAVAAIVFTSCQKEPTACFTSSTTSTQQNDPVSFTNCSVEGDHYVWDFGDGQTSANLDAEHAFAVTGTYTVKLTAYSKNGKKTDEAVEFISVTPAMGKVSFWQSGTPSYNYTDVTINSQTDVITVDFPSGIFDCQTTGTASFDLPVGTYWYDAAEWSPGTATWGGLVTVTQHGCTTVELQ